MRQVVYSSQFLKTVEKLPKQIQIKLDKLINVLIQNPSSPQLHRKLLKGELASFDSFRITRDWRVIFMFMNVDTIKLLRVKHRKDIYR